MGLMNPPTRGKGFYFFPLLLVLLTPSGSVWRVIFVELTFNGHIINGLLLHVFRRVFASPCFLHLKKMTENA